MKEKRIDKGEDDIVEKIESNPCKHTLSILISDMHDPLKRIDFDFVSLYQQ